MEIHPGEGVVKEKFPNTRKPSQLVGLWGVWNLRKQHNWEGNTHTDTHRHTHTHTHRIHA